MKKTTQQKPSFLKSMTLLVMLFFGVMLSFAQTTGIKISWNKEVGCQTYSQVENPRDPKEPLFLEDISDSDCVKVCEKSSVGYTLSNLPAGSTTTWSVVGGVISGPPTNTNCNVVWGDTGNGNLVFNINTPTGTITKTICIEKIKLPTANFNIIPQIPPKYGYLFACLDQTVIFDNTSTANGGSDLVSYHWDFVNIPYNIHDTSAAFEPSYVFTHEGTYKVTLTVTNACNCSKTFSREVIVEGKGFDISCPSVVCEGETQTYSLPFEGMEVCRDEFNWTVIGGDILTEAGGNVEVIWNDVDASGFGYVTFDPKGCELDCLIPTTIKIPVIQSQGTIIGDAEVCLDNQGRYKLPQWPTTDFQWEIVGNVSNNLADVILTDQRNEVIIAPHVDGVLTLRATYMNTLLKCGGTAEFTIDVTKPFNFYGENIICQGATSSFNTETGNLTNWTLTNASGSVISTATNTSQFNYTYNTVGNYTITAGNASASACPIMQKNISVIALPTPPTSITGEMVICPDAPYVYSVDNPDPNANYIWTITNGNPQGSNIGNQVTVVFNNNSNPYGISVVKQTINPTICNSAPLYVPVTKKVINTEIMTAVATPVIDVCANNTSQYRAFITGTSNVYTEGETYTWSIVPSTAGSITTGQGTNNGITVLWNNTNSIINASIQLVVKKCTITETFTKTFQILPQPNIVITSVNSECSGNPITFTISSTNGVPLTNASVTWNFNGTVVTGPVGVMTDSFTFENTTGANNGATVTAYVSGASGCLGNSNTATKSITVLPAPPASLSLTSNNGNAFCSASEINATLTASTSASSVTYKWFKNGAIIPGETTSTLTVSNNAATGFGTYKVRITNANGCFTTSNEIQIVQFCPGVPQECILNPEPAVQNLSSNNCGVISLVGTGSPAPISSSWDIFGPVNYANTTVATITPNRAGEYNIFYKPVYMCTSGLTATKNILKKVTIPYIPNFAYKVTCAGNNTFTVTFTDKTEFFNLVTSQSVVFSYKLSTDTNYTAIVGNTVTLPSAGSYDFKVSANGILDGVAQPECSKIFTNILITGVSNRTISLSDIKCHDTPVTFTLSGLDTTTETILWTFENAGVSNTIASPTRVFDAPGTYTITATVTNKYGCNRVFTKTITIPPICFSGSLVSTPNPATVCQGQSVTITYNAPVTNNCLVNQYVWMNGTTPISPAVNSNSISVTTPGFYWLTIRSIDGCKYDTPNRITPIFKTPPSIRLKGENTICEEETLTVQAITTATQIDWYVDGFNNGIFSNQTQINISGLTNGTHTISATVTQNGCSSTAVHTVTVNVAPELPEVNFEIVSCYPYKYKLTASANGNPTFNWSNGQIGSSIIVTEGGPYSVISTIGNCSSMAQLDVPKNPEVYMWIFPSGCFSNCKDDVANLIGPRASFKYWSWSFDGNEQLYGIDTYVAPYQLNDSGFYNLTLSTADCTLTSAPLNYTEQGCDDCKIAKGSGIKDIRENEETPYCDFDVLLNIISNYTTSQNFVLTSPNQDFVIVPGSLTLSPGSGNYNVQLIPLNGFSGVTQLILETTVDGIICQTIINITIPNCSGNNTREVSNKEVIETVGKISLYPNPTKDLVNLQFANSLENATVRVYNLLGKQMDSFTTTNQKMYTINTANYSSGMYIVVVETAQGQTQQFKLIKE